MTLIKGFQTTGCQTCNETLMKCRTMAALRLQFQLQKGLFTDILAENRATAQTRAGCCMYRIYTEECKVIQILPLRWWQTFGIHNWTNEVMIGIAKSASDDRHNNNFYATELVKTVWDCHPRMREQIKNQNFLAAHILYLSKGMSLSVTLKYDAWSD